MSAPDIEIVRSLLSEMDREACRAAPVDLDRLHVLEDRLATRLGVLTHRMAAKQVVGPIALRELAQRFIAVDRSAA